MRLGQWWIPLVLVAASVTANLFVWAVALIVGPSSLHDFFPLATPRTAILFTAIGALGSYGVYWLLVRLTPNPRPVFLVLSAGVLLLSLVPDLLLPQGMGGWSPFAVGTLMFMHIVAAVVDVSILLRLTASFD